MRQCDTLFSTVDDGSSIGSYLCPQPGQPEHYTECCSRPSEPRCCEYVSAAGLLEQLDGKLVMIVAMVVIASCVLAIILILICCFSSRCPLYNVCRVNYTQGGIIAYNKEEDPLTSCMPSDWDGHNHYSPNAIKIKPVEDI